MNPDEPRVRQMRDRIYGPQTDGNWDACKDNWLKPESVQWLETQVARLDGIPLAQPAPDDRLMYYNSKRKR